jgi:predicted metalloendopeptidase
MHRTIAPALIPVALLAAACGPTPQPPTSPSPSPTSAPAVAPPAPAKPAAKVVNASLADVGLDASALDRTADPCTDFYQFACGGWLQKTEIPADKPRWSRSFSEIQQRNELDLKAILEAAAAKKSGDPVRDRLGDFYGACMDEPGIEKAGIKPVKPLFDAVKRVQNAKTLVPVLASLHRQSIFPFFDVSGSADFKDATKNILHLDQNGLGLPDRDYYVKDDDKSKELRAKYVAHVERMMALAGFPAKEAKQAATEVMEIETALAKASKTRVERRDPQSLHNKIDRAGLEKEAPAIDWKAYFDALGFPAIKDVNVTSLPFLRAVNDLAKSTQPGPLRHYLAWHVLRATAKALPKSIVDEAFSMEQALTGQKEQRVRWKRCVEATDHAMGEALAQPFVAERFAGDAKGAAEQAVREISKAFEAELAKLDWMDEPTRAKAKGKLAAMAYLIGYPKKWRTYDFPIDRGAWAKTMLAGQEFEQKRVLAKVGTPVDRDEWQMSPPTVNAYYDPQKNHMVFPAGILQPPFYSTKASIPVNLGGMGMVVGHELTHGFDDEGSQFAADGNLDSWWSKEARARFEDKTKCIADQYGGYETLPGVKLDGKLTMGENIADNAGVMLAFHAYRALRKDAPETTVADGFTEDQQFFLSVGQVWCFKARDEWVRMAAQVDPHSPARFRVGGSLANLPDFAEAFQCKPGSAMRRASSCSIW